MSSVLSPASPAPDKATPNNGPRFPNYLQMKRRVPVQLWHPIRIASMGFALGVLMTLFVRPELGLFIVWRIVIPLAPLLFFVAPGLWRNVCPLAASNQTPRLFGFTKGREAPGWLKQHGYLIAIGLFILFATMRKVTLNYNGATLGILLIALLGAAFVMGTIFKGKSGWCSSICPLLPVQRIYGQTPFVKVANSHCEPCVGCTKNCYDFNPHVAYAADMHDTDDQFAGYRQMFVAMFPGFVFAYYLLPDPGAPASTTEVAAASIDNPLPWFDFASSGNRPDLGFLSIGDDLSVVSMYGLFALVMAISAGGFFVARSLLPVSVMKITTVFGALALNIYYWFNAPLIAGLTSATPNQVVLWLIRAIVFGLTLLWIARTWVKEAAYVAEVQSVPVSLSVNRSLMAHASATQGKPEVHFSDANKRVVVEPGVTLLAVAEANELSIEAGCRMGVCGADPVSIIDGAANLGRVGSDERATLERLGLAPNTRLACVAKVKGSCTVSLTPAVPDVHQSSIIAGFAADTSVQRVVIVGNGIAGVTAADHVRRRNPTCQIDLVTSESHHLYNRMGITRIIYGRSAMDGLYLMPDKWYDDHNINVWLNTTVSGIKVVDQHVQLATGDVLGYDRLILTTGGRGFVPPIDGFGMSGSFVLREADDATAIRRFVQDTQARRGVVAGGGLLGLEAAYGLTKLGLSVAVLERGDTLLRRQLDPEGGTYLRRYLEGLGMTIVTSASATQIEGTTAVERVHLADGRFARCDIFLVATGVASNTALAEAAGIAVDRGILVNARMETSAPNVLAAGDAVAFEGAVPGLWTVAAAQGQVAAVNAVGGDDRYTPLVPVTMLKVAGIDLTSIGRIEPEPGDEVLVFGEPEHHRYRKLLVNRGRVVGAILIGWPDEARALSEIAKADIDVAHLVGSLRLGDWSGLEELID